jgi:hypothetical protein
MTETNREINLGQLPTVVYGKQPLGDDLIKALEEYGEDKPSYILEKDENGNTIMKQIQ